MTHVRFGSQNMTEGTVTNALQACDVVIGQEVDRFLMRRGLEGKAHYFPAEDRHQSISWEPEVLDVHRQGYMRFHRSGQAEGFPFRTPARGMPFVKGRLVADGSKVAVASVWLLNSWNPVHPDKHTRLRNAIGRSSLALIRARVRAWHLAGYTVVIAGDFNSLRWRGWMPAFDVIDGRGLDRAYVSRDGSLELVGRAHEGPKTGVGNDLRHHAVLFTLTTHRKR